MFIVDSKGNCEYVPPVIDVTYPDGYTYRFVVPTYLVDIDGLLEMYPRRKESK